MMEQKDENTYVIDPRNEAELARLIQQEEIINKEMDLLPPGFHPKRGARIADLACGAGLWATTIGEIYPAVHVVAIDIDSQMIAWATNQTRSKKVKFQQGNILKPLPFEDNSLDLVNTRQLLGLMRTDLWLPLIQECYRITKPGGMLRMTETNGTSAPNCSDKFDVLIHKAYYRTHKAFNEFDYGVVANLGLFFSQAGYRVVNEKPYLLNQSYGYPLHEPLVKGFSVFMQLVKPFLRKTLSAEETQGLDQLCEQIGQEMRKPNYRCHWNLTSVCGIKSE